MSICITLHLPTELTTPDSLPDGRRELLVPTGKRLAKVTIRPTSQRTFEAHRPYFTRVAGDQQRGVSSAGIGTSTRGGGGGGGGGGAKVGVNKEFVRQLRAIFRILIPRSTSKEVWLLATHTGFLLLRTYLSLLVAQLDGKLVGDLVRPALAASARLLARVLNLPRRICRSRPMARASPGACSTGSASPSPASTPTAWYVWYSRLLTSRISFADLSARLSPSHRSACCSRSCPSRSGHG